MVARAPSRARFYLDKAVEFSIFGHVAYQYSAAGNAKVLHCGTERDFVQPRKGNGGTRAKMVVENERTYP